MLLLCGLLWEKQNKKTAQMCCLWGLFHFQSQALCILDEKPERASGATQQAPLVRLWCNAVLVSAAEASVE